MFDTERSRTGRSVLGTFTLTFVAIAALFAIDTSLAKIERVEEHAGAARLFAEGEKLVQQGRYAEAAGRLNDAVAIERDNRDYRLGLAEALTAAGRSTDAEDSLNELLQQDSTDGAANLAMARALIREGKTGEGISFYHRAIYGRWSAKPLENRVRVRFELVDLLARQNSKEDLLAELLPLQEEAPDDLATRMRIGRLLIAAGSSPRAVEVFRAILRRHPQDADAYAGLGEAEFARGNYQTAANEFFAASRLNAQDETIRGRLDLSNQVLALDPTLRGLKTGERYHRSLKLLQLALDDAHQCLGTSSPASQDLWDEGSKAVKRRVAESRQNDATEENLDLAEQLWRARPRECQTAPAATENPLVLVLAKIGQ